ncbi:MULTISPECIES: cupin domain-containing protein [Cupriavidus]|jgi:quercetin dioxygenase-like cupin family protein|uniref:Cupin domain-containing protein n=1 Tax=Cupriavidus metallidurans TaxID=119219 RepID=A0A482J1L2_9BURK|nr:MULTISPECIES: cupin domain-containing protein [Cupriavidus]KWR81619.1 cupin [Cupriavidus sp. SHE]QBP12940.1 cupin domain-containing protein [Cupriavidus metallidurans]QWC90732.1 cupin domain-containing protein [Cupriavidus metallidurans]
MRRLAVFSAVPVAFACGYLVAHIDLPHAHAQTPPAALAPLIVNLAAMSDEAIGPQVPNMGTLRTKGLVNTPSGTIAVQSGNVPKHYHNSADEIQYIISGKGVFWLGDEKREVGPGDLIVIPKGTAHAGTIASSGEFKSLAIKLPPQAAGDTHLLP